jgi:ribosomal protein S18 acetylase RimI-like enzyme
VAIQGATSRNVASRESCLEQVNQLNAENNNILELNRAAVEVAEVLGARRSMPQPTVANCSSEVRIRPYRNSDRAKICQLCCETGFLGGPVDPLFQDRELFAELFTRPYLDYEPEWIFVAEERKQVVGYLLGSVRAGFDLFLLRSGFLTTTKILLRLAGGRYSHHARSRRFIRWLLTSGFREQPKHPHSAAHLHIQIDRQHRARGVARRLWETYEERIRKIGVKQCYGAFFSRPERRPELAYARYDFSVYDRRRTTLFEPEISEPVEVVCVCKTL